MAAGLRPLSTLEALRRESVESLARRLRAARDEHEARAEALAAVQAVCAGHEQELRRARAAFAEANSVRTLQALERRVEGLAGQLALSRERELRAQRGLAEASGDLDALRQALLAAERDRRAASEVLEERRRSQLRVNDQREEEEAEEAYRSR